MTTFYISRPAIRSSNGAGTKLVLTLTVVALIATVAIASIQALQHSNKKHSPNIAGSDARRVIALFIAEWTAFSNGSGQDPRENCGEVRDAAGVLIRVAFSFLDKTTNTMYTIWYWANTGGFPWGGAHPKDLKGKGSFENGPKDLSPDWTWSTGTCGDSGNFVPRLQPAQPGRP